MGHLYIEIRFIKFNVFVANWEFMMIFMKFIGDIICGFENLSHYRLICQIWWVALPLTKRLDKKFCFRTPQDCHFLPLIFDGYIGDWSHIRGAEIIYIYLWYQRGWLFWNDGRSSGQGNGEKLLQGGVPRVQEREEPVSMGFVEGIQNLHQRSPFQRTFFDTCRFEVWRTLNGFNW